MAWKRKGVSCYTFNLGATRPTTPWLYPTEVIPLNFRARVDGVWSIVGWKIGNGVITMNVMAATPAPYDFCLVLFIWAALSIPLRSIRSRS
jgi:hypothetical protein